MMKLESSRVLLFDNSYRSTTSARPHAPFPRTKPIASADQAPRTKPILPPRTTPTTVLPNEANGMIGGMGQESRRDRPRIDLPNEPTDPLGCVECRKVRCSGRGAFPKRSHSSGLGRGRRSYSRTKPIDQIGWAKAEFRKEMSSALGRVTRVDCPESTSQTNPDLFDGEFRKAIPDFPTKPTLEAIFPNESSWPRKVTRSHENGRGRDCVIAVVWSPIFRASQRRITKRTQWLFRGDGSRKRARPPANRFPQTNPLTRYDVLRPEKCRCSGRRAFPERSQSGFVGAVSQTKPIPVLMC